MFDIGKKKTNNIINLLDETREILAKHNHTLDDILYMQGSASESPLTAKVDANTLRNLLDFEYYNGFGCVDINIDLKLIGADFWLERYEYDGAERWVYKQYPTIPAEFCSPRAISIMEEE